MARGYNDAVALGLQSKFETRDEDAFDPGLDDLLRRGLDWVSRVAPYDLATIFLLRDGQLIVRAARGVLADARVRSHALPLEKFPTLQEALETRRARAFTKEDHEHGDGDPFDHVLDLPPGHACMVVPLCAGESCFGVLTLDRAECETYDTRVVNLVEVYGQMLATAIQSAGQKVTLERLHRQDHEHAKILEAELGGDPFPVLEQSGNPRMQQLAREAKQVARTSTPVLIQGEAGTGKERLARALHLWSPRAEEPFVTLNCATVEPGVLEAELFGQAKGETTRERPGRLQMAEGGTLVLDEVGELPLDVQVKLVRVLQDGSFEARGSDKSQRVDVRILATTRVDLEQAQLEGRFREDLLYRLNVFPLFVPALRERREDLGKLCEALLSEQARRTARRGMRLTAEGLAKLQGYEWPGNLRELGNVLERATILSAEPGLGPDVLDIPGRSRRRELRQRDLARMAGTELGTLEDVQRMHIERVLQHTTGRIYGKGGAAEVLGVKPSTLQSKMKRLGMARGV